MLKSIPQELLTSKKLFGLLHQGDGASAIVTEHIVLTQIIVVMVAYLEMTVEIFC